MGFIASVIAFLNASSDIISIGIFSDIANTVSFCQ